MDSLRLIDAWPAPHPAAALVGPDGVIAQHGDVSYSAGWASVTKLFTSYAVLMAVQDEDISLDDETALSNGATVRHLLAHTSGLPFEGASPISPVGSRRIYSNSGFDLLGEIVTDRTGFLFVDYLRAQVFEPLGIAPDLTGRPSEGLSGDLSALAIFTYELLSPSLVSPGLFATATSIAFPGLAGILPGIGRFDPLDWGLGFELRDQKHPHWTGSLNTPETFGHFGGTGSFVWVDPVHQLALCGLSGRQFDQWAMEAWPALSDAVITEYLGTVSSASNEP